MLIIALHVIEVGCFGRCPLDLKLNDLYRFFRSLPSDEHLLTLYPISEVPLKAKYARAPLLLWENHNWIGLKATLEREIFHGAATPALDVCSRLST